MGKLRSEYWNHFIDTKADNSQKGNGEEFEELIKYLLKFIYGIEWARTPKSHDNNRDFWLYLDDQHVWAECKNYQKPIAMSVLAPTLVMAQIYEVNEVLFFSRSNINSFAQNKIMTFGEKSSKIIRFYDGGSLEDLIWRYRYHLPEKYSPLKFYEEADPETSVVPGIAVYFLGNAVSNIQSASEAFESYLNAEAIYYNQTFAFTFCMTNCFLEDNVEVCIEFQDENEERFSFQYFYPTVVPEKKQWYQAYLKEGEGRAVSLNMRLIRYQARIGLPQFHVSFFCHKSRKHYDWYSEKKIVNCHWIGTTRLLGSNYLNILSSTQEQLLNNPYLSGSIIIGSSGTGKTRVLTECKNIFLKHGYRILDFSGQEGFSSHYFLKEIISFLYEIPSTDVLELLEEKLISVNWANEISEYTEVEKAVRLLRLIIRSNTEELLKETLASCADIIYEKLSKNKNLLVIDNMQYAGETFQNFIEQYIYYSINQQTPNQSVLILAFNTDYMTASSSELLYNILHSNTRRLLSFQLKGFVEESQGLMYLQELTRTREDENTEYFREIIRKVSLRPYNLYQAVKYLEESNIIMVSPEERGFIVSNTDKYEILQDIYYGIEDVLEKRLLFINDRIYPEKLFFLCSIMYIFDYIDAYIQKVFQLSSDELNYLCGKNFFKKDRAGLYYFDHDIIRNFFYKKYPDRVLDCLKCLQEKKISQKISRYKMPNLLYEITVVKNTAVILNISSQLMEIPVPERLASLFYNSLLDVFAEMLEAGMYEKIYIKHIHQICAQIRQYDGSEKAWYASKKMFDIIQTDYPYAMSEDLQYYRPFIHFCCDIAVEYHLYEEERLFIRNVLNACKDTKPTDTDNKDELYVLQAIMYNRWYISYNTQSYQKEIADKRTRLMEKSREYALKIGNPKKRGLIEYLNYSDEGYNYYGYQTDRKQLLSIWKHCIIDIPKLVPEKTLNYYRKKVQYGLIDQDQNAVKQETQKALKYLEDGEYSHEPIIFRTFFLMAEVMSNLQHSPQKTYYYNRQMIDNILQMQQLLDNHKLGDILLLKGVNAFYAGNREEVYYSYKEAFEYYASGKTSRYWIKKELLEENISYSFTVLGIYKAGFDVSCFPPNCRQPLFLSKKKPFTASGIQRTGDLHLNLPLI